jgi:hypothetical protein
VILFFAGNMTRVELYFRNIERKHRLISYAFVNESKGELDLWHEDYGHRPHCKLFMDSGAFSAQTKGVKIDIDAYCDYLIEHEDTIYCYAALDVIGDWKGTARNLDYMLKRGLKPVAPFHMGSPFHELRRLAENHEYLALGGIVGASRDRMEPWLDQCWSVLRDYWPIKVHAFGVTAQWALEKYPFFSADSSSAIVGAGMGRVLQFTDGKIISESWPDYAQRTLDGMAVDGLSKYRVDGGSAFVGRVLLNVEAVIALERHINALWTERGIIWEED